MITIRSIQMDSVQATHIHSGGWGWGGEEDAEDNDMT